jgi:hypothetical protein
VLLDHAARHGCPPRLRVLLAGAPLPAKANLLTRWKRHSDREAEYIRIPSPLAQDALSRGSRPAPPSGSRPGTLFGAWSA